MKAKRERVDLWELLLLEPLGDRFWKKVQPDLESGCWLWRSTVNQDGQPEYRQVGVKVAAQRAAYVDRKGDVLGAGFLKNRCGTRRCVNPEHYEVVSRGMKAGRPKVYRTKCHRGHSPEVWISGGDAARSFCAQCLAEWSNARVGFRGPQGGGGAVPPLPGGEE